MEGLPHSPVVILRALPAEGDEPRFGFDDEDSRLNVNAAPAEWLARLDGLDASLAAAIVERREALRVGANAPREDGAALGDGPFRSLRGEGPAQAQGRRG